ncbi:MAG: electron transfer flavoprotein subunit beta/FixA family protein [Phycisphaerae bacterium]|nr:electron transfer flavoprotein subunit beta/FixA family protein [Phycisphaerae bacterium]
MRIVVLLKQVPETNAVKMDEATGTMVREGVEAIVNPLDLYAIETALLLREAQPEGSCEVVGISMGPPKAVKALREAVSMGLDSAVLISDKAFAGSDTWATSYVLAAAIRKLGGAELILCGERATDGDTGQVGPGVASFLNLPVATYVGKLELIDTNNAKICRVHRLIEDGHEVLDMDLPGVATVVKEIADPRLPTLRGKQRAKKIDVPTWGVADLDVQPEKLGLNGSPTRVVKIFKPKVARECEKLHAVDEETIEQAATRVVEYLKEKELLS